MLLYLANIVLIYRSLWDRYPSLETIITSDKYGTVTVESYQ